MDLEVNNREFLRNYRSLRDKLLSGTVRKILVRQRNGMALSVAAIDAESNFEKLVKRVSR